MKKNNVTASSRQVIDADPSVPNRTQLLQEETNFNAFLARLAASCRVQDFKLYAIWALRQALENEPWNRPRPKLGEGVDEATRRSVSYRFSTNVLDGYTLPATQWISHAGRLIFKSDQEYIRQGSDPAVGGDLWKGTHSFSRQRWDLWKERFVWIQTRGELEQDTRETGKAAAEVMEGIERSNLIAPVRSERASCHAT